MYKYMHKRETQGKGLADLGQRPTVAGELTGITKMGYNRRLK